MSDEQSIVNLLQRYCELQDAADLVGVSELFRHAVYTSVGGDTQRGFHEVLEAKRRNLQMHGDSLRTKHITSNTIVELDTPTWARARSYFTVFQATHSFPLQPIIAGRYHDTFDKVDGQWRFRERLIFSDLIGDLSAHLNQSFW